MADVAQTTYSEEEYLRWRLGPIVKANIFGGEFS